MAARIEHMPSAIKSKAQPINLLRYQYLSITVDTQRLPKNEINILLFRFVTPKEDVVFFK